MLQLPCEQYTANIWLTHKVSVKDASFVVDFAPIRTSHNDHGAACGCIVMFDSDACLYHPTNQLPMDVEVLQRDWYDRKNKRLLLENVLPKTPGLRASVLVVLKQHGV